MFQVNRWGYLTWIPVAESFLRQYRKDVKADGTIEDVARYFHEVEEFHNYWMYRKARFDAATTDSPKWDGQGQSVEGNGSRVSRPWQCH